jgi:DNA-binding transcriptional MerR regulator
MKLINEEKYYKMSELVELTGLNNHTIQFYSKKDLLPHTLSTSKNMKYYPEITVTVLNLIVYLKENLGFSIDYINELFEYYKVDFNDRGDLILQSIQMMAFEIGEVKQKEDLYDLPLTLAIQHEILEDKVFYFTSEIKILTILKHLLTYEGALELIIEYIHSAKKLARLEKALANKVIEDKGELPEVLVLDILSQIKPFILNSCTVSAFKEES